MSDDSEIDLSDIPELRETDYARARVVRHATSKPVDISLFDKEFSAESHAALGRVSRTFGILEHEILRAAIGLYGGPGQADSDPNLKKKVDVAIASSLGGRLKLFTEAYTVQNLDDKWLEDFKTKIAQGILARNHFAHGLWSEDQDGRLKCNFFERWGKNEPASEKVWMGTRDSLHQIAEANIDNARLLAEHFHSRRLDAAE